MNTVLVVDDDDTVREVVVAYLHRAGLLTTQASDGLQAVAAHAKESPRLVILDVMMPGIDGLEALSRMRQQAPEVPVILLTAKATEDDRVAGLKLVRTTTSPNRSARVSWCSGSKPCCVAVKTEAQWGLTLDRL
ncbi:response regulator [Ornithinimicrobium sp. INDO-MA30-4]|uniref:response regulator n=1 Tax=Ornithinimicrobium sp. INDO-MA30-4 TaxID=2908651 RepID=UPI00288322D2|nr:response regulator [Ornithinimicrobium sp. INDO-MA30-4]